MEFFELLWAYALVFLLAAVPFFEVIGVIPIGILAGLSTVPVTILALLGNLLTVLVVVLLVDKIQSWRKRRTGEDSKGDEEEEPSKRSLRAKKIWQKYGLPGLAIVGPLIVGSHLTAFMSVSLGGTKKSAAVWMTISLVIWSVVIAIFAHVGVDFMFERTGQEGFLLKYLQQ